MQMHPTMLTNWWVDISNDFQVFGVGIGGGDVIIWSRE